MTDREKLAERYAECVNKRRFVIEALRDENVDMETFRELVGLAMNDLIDLKRVRLEKAQERSRPDG